MSQRLQKSKTNNFKKPTFNKEDIMKNIVLFAALVGSASLMADYGTSSYNSGTQAGYGTNPNSGYNTSPNTYNGGSNSSYQGSPSQGYQSQPSYSNQPGYQNGSSSYQSTPGYNSNQPGTYNTSPQSGYNSPRNMNSSTQQYPNNSYAAEQTSSYGSNGSHSNQPNTSSNNSWNTQPNTNSSNSTWGSDSNKTKYSQDFAATPLDQQINTKIRDKLSSGWFSKGYDNLTLNTTNGSVTVSGTVNKTEDVQNIADKIRNVDGVKSVNTQLIVQSR
jgi:osmotically-inducible protein OsmY